MTERTNVKTPVADRQQPAAPAKPAPSGFGEGLEGLRSVHC
jgi:hypothetical protein